MITSFWQKCIVAAAQLTSKTAAEYADFAQASGEA